MKELKIIAISGWGQQYDSLKVLENPASCIKNIRHINYLAFSSKKELFAAIKEENINTDILIGWSLGGQIAVKMISEKILKTKLLVLIATPFQFVETKALKCGIYREIFTEFAHEFAEDSQKTLQKFAMLIAKNDSNGKNVIKQIRLDNNNDKKWRYWLKRLKKYNLSKVKFEEFPPTLIIHGRDDAVVDYSQSSVFLPFIKNCKVEMIENCGHAPHLHDPDSVRALLEKEALKVLVPRDRL